MILYIVLRKKLQNDKIYTIAKENLESIANDNTIQDQSTLKKRRCAIADVSKEIVKQTIYHLPVEKLAAMTASIALAKHVYNNTGRNAITKATLSVSTFAAT